MSLVSNSQTFSFDAIFQTRIRPDMSAAAKKSPPWLKPAWTTESLNPSHLKQSKRIIIFKMWERGYEIAHEKRCF